MYGVHPRLTLLDKSGSATGLLFLNSAAQELALTPAPGLVYRTIGGLLDMFIFLGPGPEQVRDSDGIYELLYKISCIRVSLEIPLLSLEQVVQQYTEAVGRYYIPPYWSLGFHLCRYGYGDIETMRQR